jgi:hypothetical protein
VKASRVNRCRSIVKQVLKELERICLIPGHQFLLFGSKHVVKVLLRFSIPVSPLMPPAAVPEGDNGREGENLLFQDEPVHAPEAPEGAPATGGDENDSANTTARIR